MATAETKRRLMNAGMFILPLFLVKGAGVMLSTGGPRGVEAAVSGAEETPVIQTPIAAPQWSEAQLAVADYVQQLHDTPFGAVPLFFPQDQPEPAEIIQAELGLQPPPEIVLQAILASANSATALIDGKPHKVGDEIRDTGWVIIEIDPELRAVMIQDPQGDRVETIRAGRPGLKNP